MLAISSASVSTTRDLGRRCCFRWLGQGLRREIYVHVRE